MAKLRFIIIVTISIVAIVTASPSIVIIGAGPAGITAATRLLENNFTNFKILEAESRIGGRINSVKFGNGYVDLGARWCHGEEGNIVYNMVKDLNLLRPTPTMITFYLSSRKKLHDDFTREILDIIHEISDTDSDAWHNENLTLGESWRGRYNQIIHNKYANDFEELQIAENAISLLESYALANEGAFSWFDPATVTDFEHSEGNYQLGWNGKGYKIFLDILMKKYPDPSQSLPIEDKILLEKEVTQISWTTHKRGNNVRISCSDNSVYVADHVVFTPSVGVLKERADRIFVPKLPVEKRNAINDIGFGALMKVIMYFPENWWRKAPGFLFVWTEEDQNSVIYEFPEGPTLDGRSWLTFLSMVIGVDNNPNVMTAWFTGRLVPAIELLPEELITRGIHFVMKKFLDHIHDVRKPEKILGSNWYSNPHFRGVYSFQTLHSRKINKKTSAEEDLATPLVDFTGRPIVLFAGEATNPNHYSTVHGAVETGYREADAILKIYR
ncbi:hypothetical protein JTB14_016449 [Gonioctena quinquepunctata]|nr:hypothetical protein JTB14_016449 [Gonioctena quinquepunctata]